MLHSVAQKYRRLAQTTTLLAAHLFLSAYTLQPDGTINWQFLQMPYAEHHDAAGIPLNLADQPRQTYPESFWQSLSAALPEGKDIRMHNPEAIVHDEKANIYLTEAADVFVSFLHEGAGYRNSFGYFIYDPQNPPQTPAALSEIVVFPNASYGNSGGSAKGLNSGDTLSLGRFPAKTHMGFVVVSNGFNAQSGVNTNQNRQEIFYTLKELNAEPQPELKAHTVLLYDEASQSVAIGMEDMLRTRSSADHDFNDIVFSLRANPPEAIDASRLNPVPEIVDSDGDGVLDAFDAYPKDPERAFNKQTPSGKSPAFYTLAFEDNWPRQGDYDMNDLVVHYRQSEILNAAGQIKDLVLEGQIMARGAELHNAFAIEWTGINPGALAQATLTTSGPSRQLQPESGQQYLVMNLVQDASKSAPGTAGCRFFNTQSHCPIQGASGFTLKMTFSTAQDPLKVKMNPFIYRKDQRGHEVHLPNHPPTSLADTRLFGQGDDASSPAQGRYYLTQNNLPWALHIPDTWHHPEEGKPISSAYLDFKPWAESAGKQQLDWYRGQRQNALIYQWNIAAER